MTKQQDLADAAEELSKKIYQIQSKPHSRAWWLGWRAGSWVIEKAVGLLPKQARR